MTSSNERYVIARHPNAGIGDHLSCVISSWWYAKTTKRTLIIDWRGSRFNLDKSANGFSNLFTLPEEVGGVKIITSSDPTQLVPEGPYYWPKWTTNNLIDISHVPHTDLEIQSMRELIATGNDRIEPVVIFNQHLPLPPKKIELKPFLDGIQFKKDITATVEEFVKNNFRDMPLVGVHIRHGNGENIGWRSAYWLGGIDLIKQTIRNEQNDIHQPGTHGKFADNMPASITAEKIGTRTERNMYKKIKSAVKELRLNIKSSEPQVLLFTDAPHVIDNLRQEIPDAINYQGFLLPFGAGPLHQIDCHNNKSMDIKHDKMIHGMLVELCLLQRCDALVYMPSQFTIMARARLSDYAQYELQQSNINKLLVKCGQLLARM